MYYYSTRNKLEKCTAAQAIARGIAPDGGLFVPECLPKLSLAQIAALGAKDYRGRAVEIMKLFLDDFTEEELRSFTTAAYGSNFDSAEIAPLRLLDDNTAFLELWHGPTCAFKDMALQMLPHLLTASLVKTGEQRRVCILVATSGDTGKAALEGFKDVDRTRIFVFYPKDGVSDVQRLQMVTQEGRNVGVCGVAGNFDDAQTGVKKIFADGELAVRLSAKGWFLSSANSINWGRLLPQIVYYFSAYVDFAASGKIRLGDEVNFCVPTGNFGNILAGWYAKRMGLPVGRFICASNANNVLTDFINTGVYDKNRDFHLTISPSMDILVSSNLERLLSAIDPENTAGYMAQLNGSGRYQVSAQVLERIAESFSAGFCDDDGTRSVINRVFRDKGYLMDTHTGVACAVLEDYRARSGDGRPTVVVSTASPFKFAPDVLKALGSGASGDGLEELSKLSGLEIPAPLRDLDKRAVRFDTAVEKASMPSAVEDFLA